MIAVRTDTLRHVYIVTFKDTETNIEEMKGALAERDYEVDGEPQFLE